MQAQWGIRKFNLDELYIRFLRVAQRRIVERIGRGIACYVAISPATPIFRRFLRGLTPALLDGIDAIWTDNLNGDGRETGKLTPTGDPDPSVFSTEFDGEGIRLGTAIGLYVRRDGQTTTPPVRYQEFWSVHKSFGSPPRRPLQRAYAPRRARRLLSVCSQQRASSRVLGQAKAR